SASAVLPILSAIACALSVSMSTTATRAPSRAKVSAIAAPMPEPAPVTIATLSVRRMITPFETVRRKPAWSEAQCGNGSPGLRFAPSGLQAATNVQAPAPAPAEAVLGATTRLVLAADPARIAEPIERVEHGGKVDLAIVRFAARRDGGDLHVADIRKELREPR